MSERSQQNGSSRTRARRSNGGTVVIGGGLAGLFTALKLAPQPVTVLAAAPLGDGASSAWAQGGIAAALGEGDSPEAHVADTLRAGAGIVDEQVASLVAHEAPERIDDLLRYGVPFDRDLAGRLALGQEAAHSARRIVKVTGDQAGRAIMAALISAVRKTPSIRVLEGWQAVDLLCGEIGIAGLTLERISGPDASRHFRMPAARVVIATGGIGQLYALTTNPAYACGDALAMAARAGAMIADAEFVQFHPTAIAADLDPAPLASEALRGEGAILVNAAGDRFMCDIHADAELAPRDIVARAVFREIEAGRGAFLDCRAAIGARIPDAFPSLYAQCQRVGIDPVRELIPVAPAEHYHMGGIKTDLKGRATIDGLWVCGEAACTGLHGANRLASNSLLEAVVFAARVADDIAGLDAAGAAAADPQPISELATSDLSEQRQSELIVRLRATMTRNVGVERNASGLRRALQTISEVGADAGRHLGIANRVLAARSVAVAALLREESRGGHFRSDFPETRPDPAEMERPVLPDGSVSAPEPILSLAPEPLYGGRT